MNLRYRSRLVTAGVISCAALLFGTGNLAGAPAAAGSGQQPLLAPSSGIATSTAPQSASAASPSELGLWGGAPFPYRESAAVAYDPTDRYVVVFGGETNTANGWVSFDQTWTYRAGDWTLLDPPQHPSARYGAAMVYDAADGYVLL